MTPRQPSMRVLDEIEFNERLKVLSEGSTRVHFDPFDDIDWDSPAMQFIDNDPRWILSPHVDPLGTTQWYRNQPPDRQIAIGRWRTMNAYKVGLTFESMLIRAFMHHLIDLPNNSPEFRYALHEATEECNHIQMFQEVVNRAGADVPGMRPVFKALSPLIGLAGGYFKTIAMIGILAGEVPIDHYQKAIIREGEKVPPAVLRTMQIHIAEEARHISFASEWLRRNVPDSNKVLRAGYSLVFPIAMRYLAGQIMVPPKSFAREFGVPDEVFAEAFWQAPESKRLLSGYFGRIRALATELGLMNPVAKGVWKVLGVDGPSSRYHGEPERIGTRIAV